MNKLGFFLVCYFLLSCSVFKSKEKVWLAEDSLTLQHSKLLQENARNEVLKEVSYLENEQWLEIEAQAPYRLHPDSGLLGVIYV